jgi:hypothetical protein
LIGSIILFSRGVRAQNSIFSFLFFSGIARRLCRRRQFADAHPLFTPTSLSLRLGANWEA